MRIAARKFLPNFLKTPLRVFLLTLALASPAAWAQVEVSAEVSRKTVTIGEQIEYTIRVASRMERLQAERARIDLMPSFEGLRLLSETPSYRQEIRNDLLSLSWSWSLMAEREGVARVTEGKLRYRDKIYPLAAHEITIVKEIAGAGIPPEFLAAGALPARSGNAALDKELRGKLFALLTLTKKNPYLMESIEAECVIYFDGLSLRQVDFEPPKWDGFFVEEIPLGELRARNVEIGGRRWQAVDTKRYILTPNKSGPLEIPMTQAVCSIVVRNQRRGLLNDPFFDMGMPSLFDETAVVRMPVAPLTVEVQPLPVEGRPSSFQNAVGQFSFAASVDRDNMSADELLTLRLQIGGQGWLGAISQPELPPLDGWKEMGRQQKTEKLGESAGRGGVRVFEILLRPERTGTLTIPETTYAFFDPRQGRYIEQRAGPFSVVVSKGKERELIVARGAPGLTAPHVGAVFGDGPAFIRTRLPALGAGLPLMRRAWWPVAQGLPFLLVAMSACVRLWRDYREKHAEHIERRSAGSRARRELREASAALRKNRLEEYYVQLAKALRGYFAVKLQRSAAGLTLDEIESLCQNRGLDASDAQALRRLLETADAARYLTAGLDRAKADADMALANRLLREMDKAIK
jgi:hypothetical protein